MLKGLNEKFCCIINIMNIREIFGAKFVVAIIAVVVLVVAGYFGATYYYNNRYDSRQFIGPVQKVEGDTIYAKGNFVVAGHNELSGPNKLKDVKIVVGPSTKITKIQLYLPTAEELKKTGGVYYPDKLKNDTKVVSLDVLKSDLANSGFSIDAKSVENIYSKSKFTASEISYRIGVFP